MLFYWGKSMMQAQSAATKQAGMLQANQYTKNTMANITTRSHKQAYAIQTSPTNILQTKHRKHSNLR